MKVFPIFLFFLATMVATSQAGYSSCLSWRFSVETNSTVGWDLVPKRCGEYVKEYMVGPQHQYWKDSETVVNEAFCYVNSLELAGDGKNIWIFDIDETTLSNLPFSAKTEAASMEEMIEWESESKAPALPESLKLYKKLLSLGIKVVFLTGRDESSRNVTAINLKNAGYHTWEKLILKGSSYPSNITNLLFKSNERRKLEEINGYRIIGNMGDQWSDIGGIHQGNRTFKLPNPMYYSPKLDFIISY